MLDKPHVQILLATYNGEKYLSEQLDSLIAQTYTNWECLISDDCSTDNTTDIIKAYCVKDNRFKLVSSRVKHPSLNENFLDLMNRSTAEFVLFSDQDDYWLDNKVEVLVDAILEETRECNDIPVCVFSDSSIADSSMNVVVDSFQSTLLNNANDVSTLDIIGSNVVQGCASIVNRKLIECVINEGNFAYFNVYDWLCGAISRSQGKLIFIPKSLLLYRQHDSQVCGTKKESLLHYIYRLATLMFKDRTQAGAVVKLDASVIGRAKRILLRFPPVDFDEKCELQYLDSFSDTSFIGRIKILNHFKWFKYDAIHRMALLMACIKNIDWRTHY